MEKLKQLQKYIEPLSRMINKFNEDEEKNNNDLSKMKTLRDTLMNPKKRLPMSLLDKCEKVLQNWLDQKPSQPTLLLPRADQHMCQPILNVIATATKSPLLNHTLKRTFGPAMKALCGNYTVPDFLPNKRRRLQEAVKDLRERKSANRISEEVKREIAGLDPKFNVKMDESNPRVNGNIQLLCYLNDPQLPALPPLQIVVPPKYPQQAAEWVPGTNYSHRDGDVIEEDDKSLLGTGFLARLRPIIRNRMTMMNKSSSTISSMLQEWSSSAARATNAIA
uniref:Uncharacterized protein n=1 Tax=Ciona savignyi TaxID=51511 RepID=H2YNQ5_CIOSA